MIRKKITPNQTEEVTANNEINSTENLSNTPESSEIKNTDKQPATIKEEAKPVVRTVKKPVLVAKMETSEISLSEAKEQVEEIISDGEKKSKEEKDKKKKKVKAKEKEDDKEKKKKQSKKKSKKEKKKAKAKKEKAKKEKSKDKSKKKKLKAIEKNAKIKKKAMQKLRKLLTKKSKK